MKKQKNGLPVKNYIDWEREWQLLTWHLVKIGVIEINSKKDFQDVKDDINNARTIYNHIYKEKNK